MHLLLDTHAWLWWRSKPEMLSARLLGKLKKTETQVSVSLASFWEIAIKYSKGKLKLPDTPQRFLPRALAEDGFVLLPIAPEHLLALAHLPWHHADPFDRLLVAQAQHDALTLATNDANLRLYGVPIFW